MTGFLVVALDNRSKNTYIFNTSPIMWTSNINEAKIFELFRYAKNELDENFISLANTICYSNIRSIWILEYLNNVEVRRVKYI